MRFVDVKNDVAFRKIFGNEKKTYILISFLNAVLKLEGSQIIKEIKFINPYLLPRIQGEKASIIDVKAEDMAGRQFIIEMQLADAKGFDKRVQYYTCRDYSMQIKRGEEYDLLKPTFFIGILDFSFFESENYLSHHIILNGETYEHKLKDIQFTFIELEKFNKQLTQLDNLIDKWIFFIKNSDDLDIIPDDIDDKGLIQAYQDAEKFRWTKDELIEYDNFWIAVQDARGRLELAEERGEARGEAKGIEKGDRSRVIKVVTNCLENNMNKELIAQIVDLPLGEVKKMIEEIIKPE